MRKKDFLPIITLAFLILSVGLSPSFTIAKLSSGIKVELRAEDILIIIFGLIWIWLFLLQKKITFKKPPFFFLICVWLAILLFSTLLNLIFNTINPITALFYFLKELEIFLLYFLIVNLVQTLNIAKYVIKLFAIVMLASTGWVLMQVIAGIKISYYYGPTTFLEPKAPFIGGGIFLLLFLFFINYFIYYYLPQKIAFAKKTILACLSVAPLIGVFSTGSRSAFFSLAPSLILLFFLYTIKTKKIKLLVIGIGFSILVFITINAIAPHSSAVGRFVNIDKILWEITSMEDSSRVAIGKTHLTELLKHPGYLLLGMGKSGSIDGGESHNQFIHNITEGGVIGLIFFIILMIVILRASILVFLKEKKPLIIAMSASLFTATITMLVMSLGGEAFKVVKLAEFYWIIAALCLGLFFTVPKNEKYDMDSQVINAKNY